MRVLLDNNIPVRFLDLLLGLNATHVKDVGLSDLLDGPLLDAIDGHFDMLVTMDRSLQHQQNLSDRSFAIIVLRAKSNRLLDIAPLADPLKLQLSAVQNGRVHEVSLG
jgi:predicted nuclease of predicted toxin-antitoxin system